MKKFLKLLLISNSTMAGEAYLRWPLSIQEANFFRLPASDF